MPKNLSDQDIADFRDRLCDVAERQFALHGAESVTIRQLAAAVGVSPMTPYRYFRDKDAILAAVRARAFDRHAQTLERAYAESEGEPSARAAAILEAYVDFAMQNPQAYKLMFDINQPTEAEYPDLVRSGERSRATMTRHLQGRSDAERIGHMFWAAIHGPLMLHFSGMLSPGQEARDLINALVTALGQAIFGDATALDTKSASPMKENGGNPE